MNKALFEIGQKVVCVDSKSRVHNGLPPSLTEGKIYKIVNMFFCGCGEIGVDVGQSGYGSICRCNAKVKGKMYHSQDRFVPLDFDRQADEEIHEALKGIKQEFLN